MCAHARVEGVSGRRREVERRLIAGARLRRGARKGICVALAREAAQLRIGVPGGEQLLQAGIRALHRFAYGVLPCGVAAAESETGDGAHHGPFDAARGGRGAAAQGEHHRHADGERGDESVGD